MANVLYSRLGTGPLSALNRVLVFAKPTGAAGGAVLGWQAQAPDPLFSRLSPRSPNFFWAWNETIDLDKWQPVASEPVRALPRPSREGRYERPILELVFADKWFAAASEPVRTRPEPARSGLVTPIFLEAIRLDKWFTPPSEPVRFRPEPVRAMPFAWEWFEIVSMDKWARQPSEPVRARPEPARTGANVWQWVEIISCDKWFTPPSEPVRTRPQALPIGCVAWQWLETILVDKWFTPPSEPVRARPEVARSGQAVVPTFEIITLDKWGRQPSEPVRLKPESVRTGQSVLQFSVSPEIIRVDKWWTQPSEPVRLRPEANRAGHAVAVLTLGSETILVDKWFAQPVDPMRARPDSARQHAFSLIWKPTAEVITVDKWFTQASEPVRFRPEPVRGGLHQPPIVVAQETISVDKWYAPASEPVRFRAEATRTGIFSWQISTAREFIGVEKWFVQPSEPVRFRPEAVRSGLSVVPASTGGEVVFVDRWFQLDPDMRRAFAPTVRGAGGLTSVVFIVTFDGRSGFPWPEPERRQTAFLQPAWFQGYIGVQAAPFPEVIPIDKFGNQYVDYFRAKNVGLWEGRYAYIEPTHIHPSDTTLSTGYGWQVSPGVGSVDWNPEPGPPPPPPVVEKPLKGPDEETCQVFLLVWANNSSFGPIQGIRKAKPHKIGFEFQPIDVLVPGGIHKDKLYPGAAQPYAVITSKQGQPPSFSTGGRYIDYREVMIEIFGVGDVATSEIIPAVQKLYDDQPLSWIGIRANVFHLWTQPTEVTVYERDEVKTGEEWRAARLRWMVWTDRQVHNRVNPDN